MQMYTKIIGNSIFILFSANNDGDSKNNNNNKEHNNECINKQTITITTNN